MFKGLNVQVLDFFYCVCGLISCKFMALFCVLVQVSYLSLVVNIYCFNSHFPVTILGLDVL
jgi:hypothetical protein